MLYIGLLISIFFDYVRPGSYLPIINTLKLYSLIPLLILVFCFFYDKGNENRKIISDTNSKLIIFFLILLLLSIFISDVTLYSYTVFTNVLGYIFWYYIITRLATNLEKIKGIFFILVISNVIAILLNPDVVLNPETRTYIQGNPFLGDGNDFALSATIVIPLCLFLVIDSDNLVKKILYISFLVILILSVIGTQSRGASIAMASVFLYLWWEGRRKFAGLLIIIVAVVLVYSYAPPVYFERLNSVVNYQEEGSAQGRIIAWKTAVRMAIKHPFTGVGSGHFAVKLGTEYRPPEFGGRNLPWSTAHSIYFLLLGELGFPGLIFICLLLIKNFFRNKYFIKKFSNMSDPEIIKLRTLFMMLNASLISFSIGGAFLSIAYYPHLYVLSALYTASVIYVNNPDTVVSN